MSALHLDLLVIECTWPKTLLTSNHNILNSIGIDPMFVGVYVGGWTEVEAPFNEGQLVLAT